MQQKFVAGGTVRINLEAGGYTLLGSNSEDIVVTLHGHSQERLRQVQVEIKASGSIAEVSIRNTPMNSFQATIEVPRRSNLWVRLSAGEVEVSDVEGDKDIEVRAGQIVVQVPHQEEYGHSDASVLAGSIDASAFDVSKGGLFRTFEHSGPGKYRLHAHALSGEIDLRGSD